MRPINSVAVTVLAGSTLAHLPCTPGCDVVEPGTFTRQEANQQSVVTSLLGRSAMFPKPRLDDLALVPTGIAADQNKDFLAQQHTRQKDAVTISLLELH